MPAPLLVELLTEELPPKSLKALSESFASRLFADLKKESFLAEGSTAKPYATPRRLAVLVSSVESRSPDLERTVQGPPLGAPAAAVNGFAKKNGVSPEALKRQSSAKGEVYVAHVSVKGRTLAEALAPLIETALKNLPISKLMRWGSGEAQFVRPVHSVLTLHGQQAVPARVMGMEAGQSTRGHRFLGQPNITIEAAERYEAQMESEGIVIASFNTRRATIERQLHKEAGGLGATLGDYAALLDEVTALVEYPCVYVGSFDSAYLDVPQECLILTMRQNQKYFPLFDASGKLLARFLIVSNMKVADPRLIVGGNERVVRPRLEDARFFYEQDRRRRLESLVPGLAKVVYHSKLGSQLDRVQRLRLLSGSIARKIGADAALAERAAWLCKADLLTGMVGEFPELQGVMGRYYALHDGEPGAVANAIETHYRPRFAGDQLPDDAVQYAVALADKLDTLAGLFSVGEVPTGDKDPFGLRRAALGIIRILVEKELEVPLPELIASACATFANQPKDLLSDFIYERFSGYLKELGFSTLQVDAVLAKRPVELCAVPRQLEAVKSFQALPEAESLAAANKRVANILRQAASKGESYGSADRAQLKDAAEIALFDVLQAASNQAGTLLERGDYSGYLRSFAVLKKPVDAFFDDVMVMTPDDALRRNRLALLSDLREAMNRVADISRLAT